MLSDETSTPSSAVTSLPTRPGMVKATIGVRLAVTSGFVACRAMRMPIMPEAPETSETLTSGPLRVKEADIFHGNATTPLGTRFDVEDPLLVRKRRPGLSMEV